MLTLTNVKGVALQRHAFAVKGADRDGLQGPGVSHHFRVIPPENGRYTGAGLHEHGHVLPDDILDGVDAAGVTRCQNHRHHLGQVHEAQEVGVKEPKDDQNFPGNVVVKLTGISSIVVKGLIEKGSKKMQGIIRKMEFFPRSPFKSDDENPSG